MKELAGLFPTEDYRFRMTMRRGSPAAFFRGQDGTGVLLAERKRWLWESPERHAGLQPEGVPLFAELLELAAGWGLPPAADCIGLGRLWEPDFLLLSRDDDGEFRLRGGALCFPTGWGLAAKLGRPLGEIHGVVPGLNAALGPAINQFLGNLKPGLAFHRDNWGIAATSDLNLHPTRAWPRPGLPVALSHLWLRVEHQALVALPRTAGVLFGIRIALHRLDHLAEDGALATGLSRALATMPKELAAYKGLAEIRLPLAELLAAR